MKISIWFDFLDDDTASLVFDSEKHGDNVNYIVIPNVGEKVGIRPLEVHPGLPVTKAVKLDYVVEVRHFIETEDDEFGVTTFSQETHVLLSQRP